MFKGSDGVPLGCRRVRLPPLDPAEVGQDQSRVLGGDDGPSVTHTNQGIYVLGISPFVWGSNRVGQDQSRLLSGDDEPSIPHNSHVLEA